MRQTKRVWYRDRAGKRCRVDVQLEGVSGRWTWPARGITATLVRDGPRWAVDGVVTHTLVQALGRAASRQERQ